MPFFETPPAARRFLYPPLRPGLTAWVIGDIHGRSDLLEEIHRAIDHGVVGAAGETIEICLGDYVDRGPDSAGVVGLLAARARSRRLVLLRGNHEVMFEDFLAGRLDPRLWRRAGGFETLRSYGLDPEALAEAAPERWVAEARARVPPHHRLFLRSLTDAFSLDGYFFAHAGVRPGVPLARQKAEDLQWIRDDFLGDERDLGAVVVHGHTPVDEPEFRANRIDIDTGAYATGRLTCLVLDANGPRLLRP